MPRRTRIRSTGALARSRDPAKDNLRTYGSAASAHLEPRARALQPSRPIAAPYRWMGCTGLVHGHERAVSFPQHLACSLQPRQAGPRPARPTQTSMPAPDLRPSHVQRPRSSAQALCPWSSPLATGLLHPVPSGSLPASVLAPQTPAARQTAGHWPLAAPFLASWHYASPAQGPGALPSS